MEFSTIKYTANQLKNKNISIKELSEIFIDRIKNNLDLNAYIYFDEENINNQISSHINQGGLLNGIYYHQRNFI